MMNQLTTLSDALSRSIRPENFPSEKGSGGLAQVLRPDSIYQSQIRFGMYQQRHSQNCLSVTTLK